MAKKETQIEVWHDDSLVVFSFSRIKSYWLEVKDGEDGSVVHINLTRKGRKQLRKALK